MKKILAMLLVLVMGLGAVSCGDTSNDNSSDEENHPISGETIEFFEVSFVKPPEWTDEDGDDENVLGYYTTDGDYVMVQHDDDFNTDSDLEKEVALKAFVEGMAESENVGSEDTLEMSEFVNENDVSGYEYSYEMEVANEEYVFKGFATIYNGAIYSFNVTKPIAEKDSISEITDSWFNSIEYIGEDDDVDSLDSYSEPEPVPEPEPEPELTLGQENAIAKAESYIDLMPFSKKGLIEQLEYDDFTKKDAKFAVNYIDVNWKEQAALKAESYLDIMSFSKQGLIDQLKYDGFTDKQAKYGVKAVGY